MMKTNKIFMYLFIGAIILLLYLFINYKSTSETNIVFHNELKTKITTLEHEIDSLYIVNLDLKQFSIEYNDDALYYFERQGYVADSLIPFIKDQLYDLNLIKGEHPLIPYEAMTENGKMLTNTIRLLNHKWIIAAFSDGKYGGELLIHYDIDENKRLKFNLLDHFLYPIDY